MLFAPNTKYGKERSKVQDLTRYLHFAQLINKRLTYKVAAHTGWSERWRHELTDRYVFCPAKPEWQMFRDSARSPACGSQPQRSTPICSVGEHSTTRFWFPANSFHISLRDMPYVVHSIPPRDSQHTLPTSGQSSSSPNKGHVYLETINLDVLS